MEHGWTVDRLISTEGRGHATELAQIAVNDDVDAIFIAGGDGTVQEVLDPLAYNERTAVGMLSSGGQNLWTTEMGIPRHPAGAIDAQLAGGTELIDIGEINKHRFRLVAGIGYDAEVIDRAHTPINPNGRRLAKSRLQYGRMTNQMYPRHQETTASITVDEIPLTDRQLFIAWIGNTKLLSNTLMPYELRPEAQINDGKLELTVLPNVGRLAFARATMAAGIRYAFHQDAQIFPFGTYAQGSNITIRTTDPILAHVDGSPVRDAPSQEFTIVTFQKALRVFSTQNNRKR